MDILTSGGGRQEHIYILRQWASETTAPVYAMLLKKDVGKRNQNIRLLTSLKAMPPVISWMCAWQRRLGIDGFLAPGMFVGSRAARPFEGHGNSESLVVAGFEGEQILYRHCSAGCFREGPGGKFLPFGRNKRRKPSGPRGGGGRIF